MRRPVEVFFSYAHEDLALVEEIRRQFVLFERQGIIRKWHDRLVSAGTEWERLIDERLRQSDIILLFVSPDFFESDYCYGIEMDAALRRHTEGTARVIPIILRPCLWQSAPFSHLQALPEDGRAVTQWPNRDEACVNVAQGVMRAVGELMGESILAAEPLRAVEDEDRRLEVRVHRAFFIGRPTEFYFVNLTNVSPRRTLEVTHVWYEDDANHVPVLQPARPLPVRLDADQSWETWIEVESLPPRFRMDAFASFRARISTGKIFASKANRSVPPIGSVPGGGGRSS